MSLLEVKLLFSNIRGITLPKFFPTTPGVKVTFRPAREVRKRRPPMV